MSADQSTQDLTEAIHGALGAEEPFDTEQVLGAELSTGRIHLYVKGRAYMLTVEADDA